MKTNGRLVDGTGALLPQPARIDGMKFEELCALAAECFGKEMDDLTLHADNAEADNLDDEELDAVLGVPALAAVVVANDVAMPADPFGALVHAHPGPLI